MVHPLAARCEELNDLAAAGVQGCGGHCFGVGRKDADAHGAHSAFPRQGDVDTVDDDVFGADGGGH